MAFEVATKLPAGRDGKDSDISVEISALLAPEWTSPEFAARMTVENAVASAWVVACPRVAPGRTSWTASTAPASTEPMPPVRGLWLRPLDAG